MQYGTPEQVAQQRKDKEKADVVLMADDDPDILEAKRLADEKAQKKADKNRKKREKQKQKKAEQKAQSATVNA